jgi:hypothetical protein
MLFATPKPFREALASQRLKAFLPTTASAAELEQLAPELRERALFSARTPYIEHLARIQDVVTSILDPKTVTDPDTGAARPVRHGERVGTPSQITYGVSNDEASRFGLPCGGTLPLVQEPLADAAWIDALLERTGRHELVARTVDLGSGAVSLAPAQRGLAFAL